MTDKQFSAILGVLLIIAAGVIGVPLTALVLLTAGAGFILRAILLRNT